ncbi:MAG: hypothetical protein A3G34_04670 [Candidatus Lindowbacteria bacterium RIFCSPLOWO2_12_FULL_62_27]|nr:MAG: hypothetical protein A3I06_12990 [Candidatus Lindowbacteria bacterium RIFCSPLOWO2_02_FULL_62_12]OGH61296.1 MAG: hypothetical protein A3G34_04670 [Candidatus Lindowbacteria bacterium RIFCSPLOWO2_12_FULL_62_27]
MIDPELVARKAGLIEKDLIVLGEALKKQATPQLDAPAQALFERLLERMIGRMIDINFHLITESGRPAPKDYHESFVELGRMSILEPTFAKHISVSAGLRNRIAHEYDEIDPAKLLEAARDAVKDIPNYLKQVLEHTSST